VTKPKPASERNLSPEQTAEALTAAAEAAEEATGERDKLMVKRAEQGASLRQIATEAKLSGHEAVRKALTRMALA
jgi:hypothetical protein